MVPLYGSILVASAGIAMLVAASAWNRRAAPGARGLAVCSAAMGLWAFGYAIQWVYTDHGPSLPWLAVRVSAVWMAVIGIYVMSADYAGKRALLSRRILVSLGTLLVIDVLLLLTDPQHGWYLGQAVPGLVVVAGGPVFIAQGVFLYGLMVVSVGLLISSVMRSKGTQRRHAAVLSVAVALPGIVMGLEQVGVSVMPGLNAVPAAWGIGSVLLAFELYRDNLFQFAPLARDRVIEEMPEGMLVFDRHGVLTDINPAAGALVQRGAHCVGTHADEVFAAWGASAPPVVDLIAVGSGRLEAARAGDPPRVIEVAVSTVLDQVGTRVATIAILRDVTERARNEREQREFLANASHEMQTPLAGLSLLSSMLREAVDEDSDQLDLFLDRLSIETDRLVTVTRGMLTLARFDERAEERGRDLTCVDLTALLAGEVEEAAPLAEGKRQLLALESAEPLYVNGDEAELRAVLGNLLENAVRYTPDGGHVWARAEALSDEAGARWAVVTIADDGIGIAPEDHLRVFDRFYRVDKARSRGTGGTGLGLSIVRSIVSRYGGQITLESAPGVGSVFTVRLPAA